jgi:hypothetical protein
MKRILLCMIALTMLPISLLRAQNIAGDWQGTLNVVSRPREFHPEPLAEPCVNLSIYTAPIIQPNIW